MKRLSAYAAIYLFWGASFLAIREVVSIMPPFFPAGVRFVAAGLLLFAYACFRGMKMPTLAEWRGILLLSVLFFVVVYGIVFWGERSAPSSEAAVIGATIPAMVFLLEWLVLRKVQPNWISVAGAVLGLSGVAWLVLSGPQAAQQTGGAFHIDKYALVFCCGALSWSIATVLSGKLALPKDRAVSASLQMLLGGCGLLALSAMAGEFHLVSAAMLQPKVVLGMLYLILFASIAAFSAYVYLLAHEPATRVASYAYVNPLIAVALGVWLAGERLAPQQFLASGVIILGTLATLFGRNRTTN